MWHNATKINETSTELKQKGKKKKKIKTERVDEQYLMKERKKIQQLRKLGIF